MMNQKEQIKEINSINNGQSFYQCLDDNQKLFEPIIIGKCELTFQKMLMSDEKIISQSKFIVTDQLTKQYNMIHLTNYRVIVDKSQPFCIPYGYIDEVKTLQRYLRLVLKTGLYFDFHVQNGCDELQKIILMCIGQLPFSLICVSECQYPKIYDSYAQIQRMRVDSNNFSVFKNVPSKFCSTYPLYVLVPKGIQARNLSQVRKCRWHSRIPVMSYYNQKTGVGVWRAAKRKIQIQHQVLKYDISYLRSIPGNQIILQLEQNPMIKGNLNFQSLQMLKVCFFNLVKQYNSSLHNTIGVKLQMYKSLSKWYEQVDKLISVAYHTVDFVSQEHHVLLQQMYALDRVTQVLTLVQIIMDPFFRTFDGLSILIEKQFISYGHPFQQRSGFNKNKGSEISPVFIQTLQCIHQLINTHPNCFQYTSAYLARIGYQLYTTKFKNFLDRNIDPKRQISYNKCPKSIWTIKRHKSYFNFQYNKSTSRKQLCQIRKKPSIKQFVIWNQYMDLICRMQGSDL